MLQLVTLDMMGPLAAGVGLLLTVLVPAVGWLVRVVISQGRRVAAIEARLDAGTGQMSRIEGMLQELRGDTKTLCGDMKTVCERTDWLQRTTDRHERFFETGRMDPP